MEALREGFSPARLVRAALAVAALAAAQPLSATLIWEPLTPFMDPRTGGSGVEGAAANIIGTKIYVSHGFRGGADSLFLSIYDIPTDTWTHGGSSAPDASVVRSEGVGGLAGGKHYSIAGRPGGLAVPGASVEEFTPGGAWAAMTSMPTPRRGAGAASVAGKIYVVGGDSGTAPGGPATTGGALEVFDPSVGLGGTWTTLASMPTPVTDAEATIGLGPAESGSVAGKIYVFGGRDAAGTIISAVQIYDIATGTWALGAPMPTARTNAMAGLVDLGVAEDGDIAVFGGFDDSGNLTVTELYDPLTDTWSAGPAMLFPTSEMAVGVLWDGTGIYSIGSGIFGVSASVVERLVAAPVPEPGSLLLLGAAGLAALGMRRRRS